MSVLRTPHAQTACPFGGCSTCRQASAPPRTNARPPHTTQRTTSHRRQQKRSHDPYRPVRGSLRQLTARIEQLQLELQLSPTPVGPERAASNDVAGATRGVLHSCSSTVPAHDQLQHGMQCARCRNHYWTAGHTHATVLPTRLIPGAHGAAQ